MGAAFKLNDPAAEPRSQMRRAARANAFLCIDLCSEHNFWTGLTMNISEGGVFVATYAKLPPLGAILALDLELPGGVRAECQAQVSWVQEHLGDESPAGFGAKLLGPSGDLCAMIAQFVRYREPLVRE